MHAGAAQNGNLIEVRGLVKSYPGREGDRSVLNQLDFSVTAGSCVALVGPTGCGKSTLLELLAGLQSQDSGEILIGGKPVLDLVPGPRGGLIPKRKFRMLPPFANSMFRNTNRHNVAMIFQDYAVFPWMSVRRNLYFTLRIAGVPKAEREGRVAQALRQVGLEGEGDKYPSQLSGGMRQRLALARALSVQPRILLLDEPFAAVDALTREKLQDDLVRLWQQCGFTMVLVTHDLLEAAYLADEILVLSQAPGRVLERFRVEIPRPQRRSSAALAELKDRIMPLLEAPGKRRPVAEVA
jgi:ABC-type nitrate/sulfonate/bicarbonate transport system ATPase subunit